MANNLKRTVNKKNSIIANSHKSNIMDNNNGLAQLIDLQEEEEDF